MTSRDWSAVKPAPGGEDHSAAQAVAKMDFAVGPADEAADALAALKALWPRRVRPTIEVKHDGRIDPTTTPADQPVYKRRWRVLKRAGTIRDCGRGMPVPIRDTFSRTSVEAGFRAFRLGHGSGAHAPDEYYLIDSTNPKVHGYDGAVMSLSNISTAWEIESVKERRFEIAV